MYIGFGSIGDRNPQRVTGLALRALELAGQRGVLITGWGGIARLETSPNVFFADNVSHNWLFPCMAAVIHHGGAGTSGAGRRAGVPGIITPFVGDQYAWAERVVKLGVGLRALDIKNSRPKNWPKLFKPLSTSRQCALVHLREAKKSAPKMA
jgi:sterol 3beta-glucosyltransferase